MCRSIVLAVDIEPTGRAEVAVAGDPALRISLERLSQLRELAEQRTGHPARFHWFLRGDAQIDETWGPDWLPHACPELIEEISRHRDSTGIHPHLWRSRQPNGAWSNDPADPDWVAHCVDLNCRHHAHVFGTVPRASRMGDRWISPVVMPLLRRAGIRYDLTVEPGVPAAPFWSDPHSTAPLPDMRRAPRHPYLADEDPLTPVNVPLSRAAELVREGNAVWMVPVATSSPRLILRRRYPFVERVSWPANLVMRPQQTRAHLERELSRETTLPLVLPVRTGDLTNPDRLDAFDSVVEGLAANPRFSQARFVPVEQAMERYLAQFPSTEFAGAHAR